MKKLIIFSLMILSANVFAQTNTKPFQYSVQFVLEKVLENRNLKFNPKIPLPDIKLASESKLEDFQRDIGSQWGQPPDIITNVYAAKVNRIYMLDDMSYYKKVNRCIDDSLAHELTHYVQVMYQKYPIEEFDDSFESEAIDVQTWFRENFCQWLKN